ncbi:hypothetical protein [Pseudomonas putida]|uniref:hypothetical protein n=1 Tax=Pseudomonas putida TaxID=303 RepID=UPI003905CA17
MIVTSSNGSTLPPGREKFAIDPFGYSSLGAEEWKIACAMAGEPIDPAMSVSDQLKNPILWLAHAQAMSGAAQTLLHQEQQFELMPPVVRRICERQYCAIALMLVGYSLEIALKAMIIVKERVEGYRVIEKKTKHHRLQDLASFIPDLSKKDMAILRTLTHFVSWAGRYPDPGSGREELLEDIFGMSEKHRVTAGNLFSLANRVMQHTSNVVEESFC